MGKEYSLYPDLTEQRKRLVLETAASVFIPDPAHEWEIEK